MPRKGGMPENLKPFKKGHVRIGGMKLGQKTTATILREMLEQDPETFLLPITEDKDKKEKFVKYHRELKKRKIKSVKDLIMFRTINKASQGDARALEWVNKNIYEEAGIKIDHTGNVGIDINKIDFAKIPDAMLNAIIKNNGVITDEQRRELQQLQSKPTFDVIENDNGEKA